MTLHGFRRTSAGTLTLLALLCAAPLLHAQAPAAAPNPNKVPGGVYEPVYPPPANLYPLGPESKVQPGVPQGKTFKFVLDGSAIFPDTTQQISVYVPAQYSPDKPACLWVELDGLRPEMHIVFDNLMAKHEIPVMIAVGVAPGKVPATGDSEDARLQRSYEFDALSDRLARFLMEEVIPEVEKHKTPDGQAIHISRDPNDHGIGGGSTGGIGAFTAAFERPDYFRRVFTVIGTFVGMRGGEQEYVQVRKTEPRPIRVFMNDGANDEWPGGPEMGDWHMANLTMERALKFAGYDVKHVWGDGTHNGAQGEQLFPDVQRWLWRDYPAPIVAKAPGNPRLVEIAVPEQGWQPAGATSKPPMLPSSATGPKGDVYLAQPDGGILMTGTKPGATRTVAHDLHVRGLTVRSNGDIYATVKAANGDGELWRITPDGKETKLDSGIPGASGLAFSPDGLWLVVAEADGQHGLDYRVKADGTVDAREAMYQFYVPLTADNAGTGALAFDTQGWMYAATRLGVQVFDRNGRVIAVLPVPADEPITGLAFGDADFRTLYVSTASGKMYKRPMKVAGYPPFAAPIQLPRPTSGSLLLPRLPFTLVPASAC